MASPLQGYLDSGMLKPDFGSLMGGGVGEPIIVPVPVAAPTAKPAAKKTSSSASVSQTTRTPVQSTNPWPTAPSTNFGPAPTFKQDAVPAVPTEPVWQEDLGQFLGGSSLAGAMSPPTMQGFSMPVFSSAQAFGMTPEMYNSILDTTKNNIAFNNKVAGDNYNNTLNIIKQLQASDESKQAQFSRNLQNRNAVLQGNKAQQDIAFTQSPQEAAGLRQQLENQTALYHSQLSEKLQKGMAEIAHKYRLSEISAQDKTSAKNTAALVNLEIRKKVIDLYGDVWKTAVKGLQPGDLDRYRKVAATGDQQLMSLFMEEIKNTSPVSALNMKAAFNAQTQLNAATGGALGNIFTEGEVEKQDEPKALSLDEAFKKYQPKK